MLTNINKSLIFIGYLYVILQTINMEQKQITATYAEAVKAIKEAILESRYRAARLVNKEVLALYYAIGGYIPISQSVNCDWYSTLSNNNSPISEFLRCSIFSFLFMCSSILSMVLSDNLLAASLYNCSAS